MNRISARLADDREIIYFDADDSADRRLVDPRDLAPVSSQSQMRYDAVLDEWVAIASHRQTRTHLPRADECPLCPSTESRPTEIPSPDYDVVAFENRFPSFARNVTDVSTVDDSLTPAAPAVGRCEVVCFTSDHNSSFAALTPERVRLVMAAWVDRTEELSRHPDVRQVFCFENRGKEIGVTLDHPHGQIYGYPFVTPHTRRMLDSARRYRERTRRDLFADVLAAELDARVRVIGESEHWVAFVPAAARWPVEVHLYPRRKVPDLPALSDAERDDFGPLYLDVLRRLDRIFDRPLPYIAAWHQAPVHSDRDLAYLHLRLMSIQRAPGKLKYLAGSESAMGAFINDAVPEDIAERLRGLSDTNESCPSL